jgi:hypothetical protein
MEFSIRRFFTIEEQERVHKKRQIGQQGNIKCTVLLYGFGWDVEKIRKGYIHLVSGLRIGETVHGVNGKFESPTGLWTTVKTSANTKPAFLRVNSSSGREIGAK